MAEPTPSGPRGETHRQPAYDAVYEVIRQHSPRSAGDYERAAENARVWRAVEAALDAQLDGKAWEDLEARADRLAANQDVMHDDLAAILRELGLGDNARTISPHEAVHNLVLPAIRLLQKTRDEHTRCSTDRIFTDRPLSVVRDKDGQPVPGPQVYTGDQWVQTVQVTMDAGEGNGS